MVPLWHELSLVRCRPLIPWPVVLIDLLVFDIFFFLASMITLACRCALVLWESRATLPLLALRLRHLLRAARGAVLFRMPRTTPRALRRIRMHTPPPPPL